MSLTNRKSVGSVDTHVYLPVLLFLTHKGVLVYQFLVFLAILDRVFDVLEPEYVGQGRQVGQKWH